MLVSTAGYGRTKQKESEIKPLCRLQRAEKVMMMNGFRSDTCERRLKAKITFIENKVTKCLLPFASETFVFASLIYLLVCLI
jgi:hypothetical protein